MSTQVMAGRAEPVPRALPPRSAFRLGLLGCGNVGSALVARLEALPDSGVSLDRALVRHPDAADRRHDGRFTTSPDAVLGNTPDAVIELLGGCHPARELVLDALARGIPVVTANKSLLARHGRELRAAASRSGVPLLYEAAVIAGVPFLGTFARRPHAAQASGLLGIVNGTSNFVLSRSAQQSIDIGDAVRDAQRRGYAEPDPTNDLDGTDAVEKLAVLLQQFAGYDVPVDSIEREGILRVQPSQHALASELGGAIKPVIQAHWADGVQAFVGPAFVPAAHPLHHVEEVENALLLETVNGRLLFQGPGAGPDVTATTVLDDVHEVAAGGPFRTAHRITETKASHAPETEWYLAFEASRLPPNLEVAEYLASHGIYVRRTTERRNRGGREHQGLLTWPAASSVIREALAGIETAAQVSSVAFRALEAN